MSTLFDYSELRERIRICYKTQAALADAAGIGRTSLNLKLCNRKPFTQSEIVTLKTLLCIKDKDIPAYFFTEEVHNCEYGGANAESTP